jgi:lipoate-protein ligase A
MKLLDLTFLTPAENLAGDEALLDWCETGCGGEILRFWEPGEPFIAVGYANKVATEVNVVACEARGVPILRRCSGGGTVVQGPGCLNYTLILKITEAGPLRTIASANRFILERNRTAIATIFPRPEIAARGHTDLVIDGRKFSGNAQRRRKDFLLFHGTFLLNLDLSLVCELLPMPSRRPDYRENRTHTEFLTNLNVPAGKVKAALQQAWKADSMLSHPPLERIAALAREKYATREWNFKF